MLASRSGQKLKSSGSKGGDDAAGPSISLLSKTIGTRGKLSGVNGSAGGGRGMAGDWTADSGGGAGR